MSGVAVAEAAAAVDAERDTAAAPTPPAGGARALSLSRGLYLSEEGPKDDQGEPEGYYARHSGRVVEVYSRGKCSTLPPVGARRGTQLLEFSAASRRRLLKRVAEVRWSQWRGRLVQFVLTYPYDCRPSSPEQANHELRLFRRRWERTAWGRRLGGTARAFWKREFTKRGALHWHLAVLVDDQLPKSRLRELRAAIKREWTAVVNMRCAQAGHQHEQIRTSADPIRGNIAAYFAGYTTKKGGKEHQHQVPEDWTSSGRWWGVWGFGATVWEECTLELREFVRVRRILRSAIVKRLRRAGRRRRGRRGRIDEIESPWQGAWVIARAENGWRDPLQRFGLAWSGLD